MDSEKFDAEADVVSEQIPAGLRVAVIGSASFWHDDSEATCAEIGERLAAFDNLVLITGGVSGVGECIGRGFHRDWQNRGLSATVIHVLPHGCDAWDYGTTLFGGRDMAERREILGRISQVYVVVEGGPGTEHEAAVATAKGAALVPVGRSGGCAAQLYPRVARPHAVDERIWQTLGDPAATPQEVATAVAETVRRIF